jgi:hypothetical protein
MRVNFGAHFLQMNSNAQAGKCVFSKRTIQVYRDNLFSDDEHYSNDQKHKVGALNLAITTRNGV